MLGSGIIDVAIGLTFVFGVTAALASVFTELVARFLGLRGAYLLGGLRELLDGTDGQAAHAGPAAQAGRTALPDAVRNYDAMQTLMRGGGRAEAAGRPAP